VVWRECNGCNSIVWFQTGIAPGKAVGCKRGAFCPIYRPLSQIKSNKSNFCLSKAPSVADKSLIVRSSIADLPGKHILEDAKVVFKFDS
jgi:hypothetical protein